MILNICVTFVFVRMHYLTLLNFLCIWINCSKVVFLLKNIPIRKLKKKLQNTLLFLLLFIIFISLYQTSIPKQKEKGIPEWTPCTFKLNFYTIQVRHIIVPQKIWFYLCNVKHTNYILYLTAKTQLLLSSFTHHFVYEKT